MLFEKIVGLNSGKHILVCQFEIMNVIFDLSLLRSCYFIFYVLIGQKLAQTYQQKNSH